MSYDCCSHYQQTTLFDLPELELGNVRNQPISKTGPFIHSFVLLPYWNFISNCQITICSLSHQHYLRTLFQQKYGWICMSCDNQPQLTTLFFHKEPQITEYNFFAQGQRPPYTTQPQSFMCKVVPWEEAFMSERIRLFPCRPIALLRVNRRRFCIENIKNCTSMTP